MSNTDFLNSVEMDCFRAVAQAACGPIHAYQSLEQERSVARLANHRTADEIEVAAFRAIMFLDTTDDETIESHPAIAEFRALETFATSVKQLGKGA